MPSVKIQLEFRIGGEGFSEIYYHGGSDPKISKADADALIAERKKLLVRVGTIHHVRISMATPGARAFRYPVFNGAGLVTATKTRDQGAVTATVGLYGANNSFRKLQLHGLPDDYHSWDVNGNPNPALGGDMTNFLTFLQTNQYQIRHTKKLANDNTLPTVHAISVAVGGEVTFTVDTTGLSNGQKVRISGPRGVRVGQFRGTWTVSNKDATTFKSRSTRSIDPSFTYIPDSAKLRDGNPDAWEYNNISDFDLWELAGSRRVGRPTDSPRGRRSRQR